MGANTPIASAAKRTARNPQTVSLLQHAVRGNAIATAINSFAKMLNEQSEHLLTIRGLFRIKTAEAEGRAPVPLAEVEPAVDIVKRFSTGAMSFGSISQRSAYHPRDRHEPYRR